MGTALLPLLGRGDPRASLPSLPLPPPFCTLPWASRPLSGEPAEDERKGTKGRSCDVFWDSGNKEEPLQGSQVLTLDHPRDQAGCPPDLGWKDEQGGPLVRLVSRTLQCSLCL